IQSVKTTAPQLLNPDPAIIGDVRFRRALVHALDLAALNDLINVGVAPPPSGFLVPIGAPESAALKSSIVEYPYDTRRATQPPARYSNPDLDKLIDRFFVTIAPSERVQIMGGIAHIITDQVTQIVTYHTMHAALINNRVKGATPRTGLAQAWDSHLWDIS